MVVGSLWYPSGPLCLVGSRDPEVQTGSAVVVTWETGTAPGWLMSFQDIHEDLKGRTVLEVNVIIQIYVCACLPVKWPPVVLHTCILILNWTQLIKHSLCVPKQNTIEMITSYTDGHRLTQAPSPIGLSILRDIESNMCCTKIAG